MTAHDVRKKFLEFFASKGHTIVASDTLVPKEDPTVLFTTAGMQQFKRRFLGYAGDYARAASAQKCLRTDDLSKIGKTDVHHTFFEMLGNFSFGDYFKKEAIAWAWEFLTKVLKIPAENLWVSVYQDDNEAKEIWQAITCLDPSRIVRLGDRSNFWPAEAKEKGPNGPCGPCSEIFFDYGLNPECRNKECDPSCECGRFSEIWNLVFTQFDRRDGGLLELLPNKNIDTGMGLERLVAVVQGKQSNYETDLFVPLIESIHKNINKDLSKEYCHVIADHARAIVFAINDGVIPSNKERGAVVKKLIYEATDIALRYGKTWKESVYTLVDGVVDIMHEPYPELLTNKQAITNIVKETEKAYVALLNIQIPELEKRMKVIQDAALSDEDKIQRYGELAFLFRDTHGLPFDRIRHALEVRGIAPFMLDAIFKIYDARMERQKAQSRSASKMPGDVFADEGLELDIPQTEFKGYEEALWQCTGKILCLFINNQKVLEASVGDRVKVALDQTPFYAKAGGQIGDSGYLIGNNGKIRVTDTQKFNDVYIHLGIVEQGLIRVGEKIVAQIDSECRTAIMKNHTATHLLQAALREVLGRHVQQQGSLVAADRLRFDFSHPKALHKEEIKRIEDRVSAIIASGIPIQNEVLSLAEAKKKGALAFFADKYGDRVRVVTIGDVSQELCAGTHLQNTSEIGIFKITSEGAVAQGIRRLEAKTAREAEFFIQKKEAMEREQAELAKTKQNEAKAQRAQLNAIIASLGPEIQSSLDIGGTKIFNKIINAVNIDTLKGVADFVKQAAKSSAVILGSQADGTATVVVALTDDLVKRGVNARDVVKEIAPLMNGHGGGQPQLAQVGSRHCDKIDGAMAYAIQLIQVKLST